MIDLPSQSANQISSRKPQTGQPAFDVIYGSLASYQSPSQTVVYFWAIYQRILLLCSTATRFKRPACPSFTNLGQLAPSCCLRVNRAPANPVPLGRCPFPLRCSVPNLVNRQLTPRYFNHLLFTRPPPPHRCSG